MSYSLKAESPTHEKKMGDICEPVEVSNGYAVVIPNSANQSEYERYLDLNQQFSGKRYKMLLRKVE